MCNNFCYIYCMNIDEINDGLKSIGFTIEDDVYTLDRVSYKTVVVNGVQHKQPIQSKFQLKYFGVGCEVDDSDSDIEGTEFHQFGVVDEDGIDVEFSVSDFDELKEYLGIK